MNKQHPIDLWTPLIASYDIVSSDRFDSRDTITKGAGKRFAEKGKM